MRIGAIDLGTNTVLLLIADVDESGGIVPVRQEHNIARLGRDVDKDRRISTASCERAGVILRQYAAICAEAGCERIVAKGTSALRDAGNRDGILATLREMSGIRVETISGDEEAELTFRGAVSGFVAHDSDQPTFVLDIGGGSTEIICGRGDGMESATSLDIGAVRITERFLPHHPPGDESIDSAVEEIRRVLAPHSGSASGRTSIGVAGTLTTLAAMDLGLLAFDPWKVEGHRLSFQRVGEMTDFLRMKTLAELEAVPQILPGRADVILAGSLILHETMSICTLPEIVVSDRGLRYGIALAAAHP